MTSGRTIRAAKSGVVALMLLTAGCATSPAGITSPRPANINYEAPAYKMQEDFALAALTSLNTELGIGEYTAMRQTEPVFHISTLFCRRADCREQAEGARWAAEHMAKQWNDIAGYRMIRVTENSGIPVYVTENLSRVISNAEDPYASWWSCDGFDTHPIALNNCKLAINSNRNVAHNVVLTMTQMMGLHSTANKVWSHCVIFDAPPYNNDRVVDYCAAEKQLIAFRLKHVPAGASPVQIRALMREHWDYAPALRRLNPAQFGVDHTAPANKMQEDFVAAVLTSIKGENDIGHYNTARQTDPNFYISSEYCRTENCRQKLQQARLAAEQTARQWNAVDGSQKIRITESSGIPLYITEDLTKVNKRAKQSDGSWWFCNGLGSRHMRLSGCYAGINANRPNVGAYVVKMMTHMMGLGISTNPAWRDCVVYGDSPVKRRATDYCPMEKRLFAFRNKHITPGLSSVRVRLLMREHWDYNQGF